uniref:Uncharacterized protein n=1 Tax=Anguilla anguilla TaxID=7936 RepID=A0A0E9WHK4_ANGAN
MKGLSIFHVYVNVFYGLYCEEKQLVTPHNLKECILLYTLPHNLWNLQHERSCILLGIPNRGEIGGKHRKGLVRIQDPCRDSQPVQHEFASLRG